MKKTRQEKIAELITNFDIETQDELIARLREHHFDVTQATVSRDIREMHISKMTTGRGTYRYVLPPKQEKDAWSSFSSRLLHSIVSVDHAQNIVVVKSHAGLAGAVAVSIDAMNQADVLGCVAGDDTVMIVCRDESCAAAFEQHLCSHVRLGE
jgi:transcriptional regulator of arginine metabolism